MNGEGGSKTGGVYSLKTTRTPTRKICHLWSTALCRNKERKRSPMEKFLVPFQKTRFENRQNFFKMALTPGFVARKDFAPSEISKAYRASEKTALPLLQAKVPIRHESFGLKTHISSARMECNRHPRVDPHAPGTLVRWQSYVNGILA